MLNRIWLILVVGSVLLAAFAGKLDNLTQGAFNAAKEAVVSIALPLSGLMALWLGFLRLAERSGVVSLLAKGLRPLLRRLFPEVPADHPAMGAMVLNMAANMLGLGNAATPLGLKAMAHLESLNPHPGIATNAMCTFLAINTSSIQLVPATAVAILAAQGAQQPTAIVGTAFLATCVSTAVGIASAKFLERLRPFRMLPSAIQSHRASPSATNPFPQPPSMESTASEPVPSEPLSPFRKLILWAFLGSFALLLCVALFPQYAEIFCTRLRTLCPWAPIISIPSLPPSLQNQTGLAHVSGVLSLFAIPFLLAFFTLNAALRGIKVYEEFVAAAKEGVEVALRILPPLVAILVSVKMFREAGGILWLTSILSPLLQPLGIPSELLPLILIRPLSGGATTALFAEVVSQHGPDSFLARTAGTIFGSTETTFYVLAVYFGAIGVRNGRHSLAAGLLADIAGAGASIAICRWMFS